jgi:hypothetical protein
MRSGHSRETDDTEPALWRELFTEDPYLQRLKFPADLFSKLC